MYLRCGSVVGIALCLAGPIAVRAHDAAADMARAAETLLDSLKDAQRDRMVFAFADKERENWHYVPRARRGLPLKEMSDEQRQLTHALLASVLSEQGHGTTREIIGLERVLAVIENNPQRRDPEMYFVSIFGAPGPDPWGWRFEGHHVSLNVTIAGGGVVITTPHFFGANPAEVRSGPRSGLRALAAEEDLGRAFVRGLSAAQRATAIILARAPGDIINAPGRAETVPQGITWSELTPAQQSALRALVRHYLNRFRPDIAAEELQRIEQPGATPLHFAWAGSLEPRERHYYRIQNDRFIVEYDNTQNDANHVHTVWRDFDREFGHDALAEHYQAEHAVSAPKP